MQRRVTRSRERWGRVEDTDQLGGAEEEVISYRDLYVLDRNRIFFNIMVKNAIIDMYVKLGFIEYASNIFATIKERDVISWTVIILGYSIHGQGELGVNLFREMEKDSRIGIDQFTYAAVLHACSTARMVEKGWFYFNRIRVPKITHCVQMVSLLARARLFDEARTFIEERHLERHPEVLRALLDGCRIHWQVKSLEII
ncbi:hypothetical protein LWI28_004870 [Acer negundo]|uniref:Pentatricopeptide repeat-containing protein n=1 Tax=Acer negundo TaxID=4023 RepID=A0AAD5IC56_ACENE|nr:hypothetical protein LWI28_004870 [Acer negundo]KAK4837532.1 hypothetical protein QYF36_006256 [Acer negundo]